jgi:hypothetical protein
MWSKQVVCRPKYASFGVVYGEEDGSCRCILLLGIGFLFGFFSILLISQLLSEYSVFIKYIKLKKLILMEGGNAKFFT